MATGTAFLVTFFTINLLSSCRGVERQTGKTANDVSVYEMTATRSEESLNRHAFRNLIQSHRAFRQNSQDDFIKNISNMVKDGMGIGQTLLQLTQWPLDMASSLHSIVLMQIGTLISLFNFFASFVTPGGSGSAILSWLRGDAVKMSRSLHDSPWADARLSSFNFV